jgi:hypothetical protein
MQAMKKPPQFRHYVRTTPRIKRITEGLRDRLAQCEPYASRRKKLTYEATINAAWLWLDSLEPEVLAANLGPYIEQFERMWPMWSKETEAGVESGHRVDADLVLHGEIKDRDEKTAGSKGPRRKAR